MQTTVLFVTLFTISLVNGCTDTSTNCASWNANGFCTSTFYTSAQKSSYCAATCGLCSGSSDSTSSSASSDSTVASSDASSTDAATSASDSSSTDSSATTTGSSGTCVDSSSTCASWVKNGFCTSTFYTDAVKKANCGKSCNLC